MKPDVLVGRGEALHQELGREAYLTGAGLKDTPEFQRIYERYADLCGDDALEAARATGSSDLVEWVVDLQAGRRTAKLEEDQLRWEQGATLRVAEREIPYLRSSIDLANSPDRDFRIALDQARVTTAAGALNGLLRDRLRSSGKSCWGSRWAITSRRGAHCRGSTSIDWGRRPKFSSRIPRTRTGKG